METIAIITESEREEIFDIETEMAATEVLSPKWKRLKQKKTQWWTKIASKYELDRNELYQFTHRERFIREVKVIRGEIIHEPA